MCLVCKRFINIKQDTNITIRPFDKINVYKYLNNLDKYVVGYVGYNVPV